MDVTSLLSRVMSLPKSVRLFGAIGLTALIAISIVCSLVAHPSREAIFAAPLTADQVTEVEQQLAAWSVPFTPEKDNLVVDASRRNDVLLRLSLAGVPHEHVATSNESLANVGVLTPQSVVDEQARAGLAGDIEVALRSVSGIEDARVIIAPARAAEFADERSAPATASVRVRVRPGTTLGMQTVEGLRAFVAASVQGLDAKHVTILDDRGVALGDASSTIDADALQRSLQSALDAAFGSGATIVRVHAEYDRREIQGHDVARTPAAALLQRESQREQYADGDKRYQKISENEDRGSVTHELTTQQSAGAITRLTGAVFVDRERHLDITAVRALAAATIGLDVRRGDTLEVQAVALSRAPAVPETSPWWMAYGLIAGVLPWLVLVIALALAGRYALPPLVAACRPIFETTRLDRAAAEVSGLAPSRVRIALQNEPPHAAAAIISALPAATAAAVLELYPPHEREAIVRRMGRAHANVVPHPDEVLAHA